MTPRRLVALVRYLPPTGAVYRAEAGWDDGTSLVALLVEQIDALTRLLYSAHTNGKRPPWDPVVVPRPATAPVERRAPTAAEMAEWLG